MKTTAKIERLLKQINTLEEWNVVCPMLTSYRREWVLNERIKRMQKIKEENRQIAEAIRAEWKIGDRVKFTPTSARHYQTCLGVIIKRNPKRAKVQVYVGQTHGIWMVPYKHLTKIIDKQEITLLAVGKMEE